MFVKSVQMCDLKLLVVIVEGEIAETEMSCIEVEISDFLFGVFLCLRCSRTNYVVVIARCRMQYG